MNTPLPLALQPPAAALTLRPVLPADRLILHTRCWHERNLDAVDRQLARARRLAEAGIGLGAVAVVAGGAAAFGQVMLWTRCAEISDLIVWCDQRHQGLGTALIQYLVRAAREMGAECVEIGAALDNHGALRLYRRLGFRDSHHLLLTTSAGDIDVQYLRLDLAVSSKSAGASGGSLTVE